MRPKGRYQLGFASTKPINQLGWSNTANTVHHQSGHHAQRILWQEQGGQHYQNHFRADEIVAGSADMPKTDDETYPGAACPAPAEYMERG